MPQKFGFVLSNCTDPAKVHELNHWYSAVHVLDIISTEGFVRATRYGLSGDARPDQWQFVALYEIQTDDPYREINQRQMQDMGRINEQAAWRGMPSFISTAHTGFFEQVGPEPIWSPPGEGHAEPPRALVLDLAVCDEDASDTVERWYTDTQLPAAANSGGIERAAVYRWPRPRGGKTQFLALYALGDGAPETAERSIAEADLPDGLERLTLASYAYLSDIVRSWPSWDDLAATAAPQTA